ncbi:XRE family transcriptional regulator [Pararobbsia alpina]|nr:XRE family transcriptional regulator [Pararobbsia alpina]
MSIKRARITSRLVATYVGVKERDVDFWRAGITVPHGAQCQRLSQLLGVDLSWLCLAAAPVVREYGHRVL